MHVETSKSPAASDAASKRVRFSVVINYIENDILVITPEEIDNLWWSRKDFQRFRKIAKKTAQTFKESFGDLKTIEEAQRRAKTLAAMYSTSDWMLRKNYLAEIVSEQNKSKHALSQAGNDSMFGSNATIAVHILGLRT